MSNDPNDTIVAISSAAGNAARGIVRLSGPDALTIASELTPGAATDRASGYTRLIAQLRLGSVRGVPCELYVFRAPRSYTGQDLAEIHTVGGSAVLGMLLEHAIKLGARPAGPGEFTERAFLAGVLDLTQAEAVSQLIAARSDAELRAARRIRQGQLAEHTNRIAADLADLLSLVEAGIDFAEEPIEFLSNTELTRRIRELLGELDRLLSRSLTTERMAALPRVLLIGRPNAGKSSLMNALTGLNRSICSAVAGTTRDVLSAPLKLGRREALLLDAAGKAGALDDESQLAGGQREDAAATADLLCLVTDLTQPESTDLADLTESTHQVPKVIVGNKVDLLDNSAAREAAERLRALQIGPVVATSATAGAGIDELKRALEKAVGDGPADACLVLTARQRDVLQRCREGIRNAVTLITSADEPSGNQELIAWDLREALAHIGELSGTTTAEDLLERIFAGFCIGK